MVALCGKECSEKRILKHIITFFICSTAGFTVGVVPNPAWLKTESGLEGLFLKLDLPPPVPGPPAPVANGKLEVLYGTLLKYDVFPQHYCCIDR